MFLFSSSDDIRSSTTSSDLPVKLCSPLARLIRSSSFFLHNSGSSAREYGCLCDSDEIDDFYPLRNDELKSMMTGPRKVPDRDESVRVIILSGSGRAFWSGDDLTAAEDKLKDDIKDLESHPVAQMERCRSR
ncbi:hypothetical protein TIFTF001_007095 [Ficus carica]|uniref:Uncharacterized protein n=1 Tax=Ficus carica TaxID=3494 RepID=A0AA87ZIP6_FICCA|nr:hypothetical protein TIFTF001_007095 [Ficus carica]